MTGIHGGSASPPIGSEFVRRGAGKKGHKTSAKKVGTTLRLSPSAPDCHKRERVCVAAVYVTECPALPASRRPDCLQRCGRPTRCSRQMLELEKVVTRGLSTKNKLSIIAGLLVVTGAAAIG